ncbi:MAG TPA: hypothetical protein EYP90_14090 [Chromatiaceae bacterium]|nr:hypothetical protein [Chromatiaceae bacterium]
MSKHIIRYRMPFVHEVHIGIEAENQEKALQTARELIEAGREVPLNNPLFPVLRDSLKEADGAVPQYTALKQVETRNWPQPDDSVDMLRRRHFANLAASLLVQAIDGQNGINRELLNQAYLAALPATASPDGRPLPTINRMAVVIEGGIIQSVVADRPQEVRVATVEYSPDGFATDELRWVTQGNGHQAQALVVERFVEEPAIHLDDVFDPS